MAATAPLPAYRIRATLSMTPPQIRGTVAVDVRNDSARALESVVLLLFPNRFSTPDATVTDVNRPYIWWREAFSPGSMRLEAVRVGGQPVEPGPYARPGVPDGCLLDVPLPHALAPGDAVELTAEFVTTIPLRYGTFGLANDMLTALGGWYPVLAWLRPDGTWAVDTLPALADYDLDLDVPADVNVLVNGRFFAAPAATVDVDIAAVHALTLVAAPDLRQDDFVAGATHVRYFSQPEHLAFRLGVGPDAHDETLDALRNIVAHPPRGMPSLPASLVVVAAPLRWELTAPGDGMVVISDRTLHVFPLIRPFHERELARALYAEVLRPTLAPREPPIDYPWVQEGSAHVLAERYRKDIYPSTRTTRDWIELFNIFAIVDRFETAPKMPFAETLFDDVPDVDSIHDRFATFNNALPPGHVILDKLDLELGAAAYEATVDACLASAESFRSCTATQSGRDLTGFYEQWVQPYPTLSYSIAEFAAQRSPAGGYETTITIQRDSSRPIREPVPVVVRSIGGESLRLTWDGDGATGHLRAEPARWPWQVVVDPGRQLLETSRAGNARPPIPQIVLDSAAVEVSSTEFAFAGLAVARGRYDYRKDLALFGFYTNRGIGGALGPRLHWGPQNDANSYRHNAYAFYGIEGLDSGFTDKQHPTARSAGHINGLGVRYSYNTVVEYNNPTDAVGGRVFVDWFDTGLGSDFDYVRFGGGLGFTHPLLTHRTILAGEVFNGFIEPTGSTSVPIQGLFSLGGSLSIRGIGAEEELARNLFLLRLELRQMVYPEVDLSLFDLLVLRRSQVHLFVDTGQVSNSAGQIYNPSGYAVGVGVGVAAMYEFMGFFPHVAYLELATQARGPGSNGGVQVLFGTRQSF